MKTRDARSLSAEAQADLRQRAVSAVVDRGLSHGAVGELFGVHRGTVCKWVNAFRRRGERALAARRRGRKPGGGKLLGWQAAWVVNTIRDRCPEQMKLPWMLWTRDAIRELIRRRFGVELARTTLGVYLRRWGFTPQRPAQRAYEQDPNAVRRWMNEEYPALRRRAEKERAVVYWGDETGMRSDDQRGRSYGLRGRTPVIPRTGRRFGCNVIAAITNQGALAFRVFDGSFVSAVFIDFLRRLCAQAGRKVILIVDRHPVHRSARVRRWVEAHRDEIELVFLPPYSPTLNPTELLNHDLKANALRKRRVAGPDQLKAAARAHLRRRQAHRHLVRRFFLHESVRYAA